MHISPQEARKIVDALACGVDPETGELLDASASHAALNSPRTVRALFLASRVLAEDGRTPSSAHRPGKAGLPWSAEEDRQLLQSFDAGASVQQLATQHQRSRGGITSRLVRLGRIQERSEAHRPRQAGAPANEAPA